VLHHLVRQNKFEILEKIIPFYLKYFKNDKILLYEWLTSKNQHNYTPLDESIVSNFHKQIINLFVEYYKICGRKFDFFGKYKIFHLCAKKNDIYLFVF
jgi:hypothetical protein